MSCRDEILDCARHITSQKGSAEFTIEEVLDCMRARGSKYPVSTIRTHITSRLCVNAPAHHGVRYADLERTAHGTYRLNRGIPVVQSNLESIVRATAPSKDAKRDIRQLPLSNIPAEMSAALQSIGEQWAASDQRPRVNPEIKKHWEALIDSWAESRLPLAIRKSSGVRGAAVLHCTGRTLILADNSPAQWAFSRAYAGYAYSLAEIEGLLQKDKIPFTFATKAAEKAQMTFKCTLSAADCLNKRGWKLCHIQGIGLNTKTKVEEIPIEILTEHFRNLLKPSNHFVIPLVWAGLGEVNEIIEAVKALERGQY